MMGERLDPDIVCTSLECCDEIIQTLVMAGGIRVSWTKGNDPVQIFECSVTTEGRN